MNCDEATAQAYGWELDVAPQIIAKSGRALPSLPDVAKNALPAQGAPAEIGPQEAMPEVVKPTTKPRTTKK